MECWIYRWIPLNKLKYYYLLLYCYLNLKTRSLMQNLFNIIKIVFQCGCDCVCWKLDIFLFCETSNWFGICSFCVSIIRVEFVWQIWFSLMCEDFVFYWTHRLLHLPYFYKKIHKIHHEFGFITYIIYHISYSN